VGKIEHTLTIDGKTVTVPRGTLLLEACRNLNINIPTLCFNENIEPYGVCRLCMVEIVEESHGRKKTRLAPSCVYEIRQDGLVVTTNNDRIFKNRQWILKLLLARCQGEPTLVKMAKEYDVTVPERLTKRGDECILCALCVRACAQIVGVAAITFEGRGENREVTTPWHLQSDVCIACGTCAYVCPTNAIFMIEKNGVRSINRRNEKESLVVKESKMLSCEKCGNYYLPAALPEVFEKTMEIDHDSFKCPSCR